ncbi:MAG TPA: hypothetical protein VNZ26_11475 [Vicinamibacterales bacterium]|jgi:hypothetical protein|nr:hypothetical protein [Vicinamibacterales bacterium]
MVARRITATFSTFVQRGELSAEALQIDFASFGRSAFRTFRVETPSLDTRELGEIATEVGPQRLELASEALLIIVRRFCVGGSERRTPLLDESFFERGWRR